ncbi:hypothetical protein BGZ99_007908 [Dissophora globulifera]|uniref:FHA domain-containing protein n=1 Tax=Dissophora globulifera TaxID=979702 RepID=A0A9P6UZ72_9FUNG|nr:hypothetical protein BGZ99_007908 [Dissophora globulifera]
MTIASYSAPDTSMLFRPAHGAESGDDHQYHSHGSRSRYAQLELQYEPPQLSDQDEYQSMSPDKVNDHQRFEQEYQGEDQIQLPRDPPLIQLDIRQLTTPTEADEPHTFASRRFVFGKKARLVLGRAPSCGSHTKARMRQNIDDQAEAVNGVDDGLFANQVISRTHAIVYEHNGDLILEDGNSTHGTYVNDKKVQRCVLNDRDRVRLGRYVVRREVPYTPLEFIARIDRDNQSLSEDSDDSVEEVLEEPLEGASKESFEEILEDPFEEISEELLEEVLDEPLEKLLDESLDESLEEPLEEPLEEVLEELSEEVSEEPLEELFEETQEETLEEISKEHLDADFEQQSEQIQDLKETESPKETQQPEQVLNAQYPEDFLRSKQEHSEAHTVQPPEPQQEEFSNDILQKPSVIAVDSTETFATSANWSVKPILETRIPENGTTKRKRQEDESDRAASDQRTKRTALVAAALAGVVVGSVGTVLTLANM